MKSEELQKVLGGLQKKVDKRKRKIRTIATEGQKAMWK